MRSVLSISLLEKVAANLEEYAKKSGRTKSDIVKESISLYLWEARFRKIRKELTMKAKKVGIVSEGDIFKAVS
jgi:predicted DNA-binding protein